MALIPIILSGGAGTRLWPLSRESAPKPFMTLPGDGASEGTLLTRTFARATALSNIAALITITHRDHYFDARDAYTAVSHGQTPPITYLLEPCGRNTAAAVALGALWAEAIAGGGATLLVLPADHLIHDQSAFAAAVESASALAREGWLAAFGIAPTRPETGYGYLERGEPLAIPDTFRVRRFTEKPSRSDASRYVASGGYLWNSGMFCFNAATVLAAFAQHSPALLAAVRPVWQRLSKHASSNILEIDAALFESVPEHSFDVAVMEKAQNVAVFRARFDWSDVGSWQAVLELAAPDEQGNREGNREGNRGQGECITIATRDTYVYAGDRVVATVGVEGLVVVDTPDAVLVAHRTELQRVKEVVAELKARGHDAYRTHRTVTRPWGSFTVLDDGPGFKTKRLEVKPGAALSLQLHERRSEHWVVVGGEARVTHGDRVYALRANESTFIPAQTRHRLENPGTEPLVVIEVQCGDYLGEDDIVRLEDRYGRVKA